jgi:hypothetical protein
MALNDVIRIPISGPTPYNTLVYVSTASGSPIAGTAGQLSFASASVITPFKLQGFDPRVLPKFDHSTTAWLFEMGPNADSEFQFAVNSITGAGFDPNDGSFFVNLNVAILPPTPVAESCVELGQGFGVCWDFFGVRISSYVLVYEPPPAQSPGSGHIDRSQLHPVDPLSFYPSILAAASTNLGPGLKAFSSLAKLLSGKSFGVPVEMPPQAVSGNHCAQGQCGCPKCQSKSKY